MSSGASHTTRIPETSLRQRCRVARPIPAVRRGRRLAARAPQIREGRREIAHDRSAQLQRHIVQRASAELTQRTSRVERDMAAVVPVRIDERRPEEKCVLAIDDHQLRVHEMRKARHPAHLDPPGRHSSPGEKLPKRPRRVEYPRRVQQDANVGFDRRREVDEQFGDHRIARRIRCERWSGIRRSNRHRMRAARCAPSAARRAETRAACRTLPNCRRATRRDSPRALPRAARARSRRRRSRIPSSARSNASSNIPSSFIEPDGDFSCPPRWCTSCAAKRNTG